MRAPQKSLLLFGEGKTEAAFLSHLRALYRTELTGTRVNVDAGRGGSSQCVAERLMRKHLDLQEPDGALLMLDGHIEVEAKVLKDLERRSVQVVLSEPVCLEGLFLRLLDDPGPKSRKSEAAKLKAHFQQKHLGCDRSTDYVAKLKHACPKLFPKVLIEQKRQEVRTLAAILSFLHV